VLDPVSLEDAMDGVQEVYHCAAVVSFEAKDRRIMRSVNVQGTANMVNAALDRGVEKFLHVSSIAALGKSSSGQTLDERSQWQRSPLNSHYALTKFQAEMEVWRGQAEGLTVGIVNPAIILGSGNWKDGAQNFFRLVDQGFPFYTSGGTGFVDVRDVARFLIQYMESERRNERYILSAQNVSYRCLLRWIAEALDQKPPRIKITPWMLPIVWRAARLIAFFNGRPPFITRETATSANQTYYFDHQKSIRDFNFDYIPIKESVRATARQYREAAEQGFPARILPLR